MDLIDFHRIKRDLNDSIAVVKSLIDETEEIYRNNTHVDFTNYTFEKIRMKLIPLLINGVELRTAKGIVAEQLGLNYQLVTQKMNAEFYDFTNRIKPHKIYACHKLKEAGIKNKQIAELLNISPAMVTKYLCIPYKIKD